MFHARRQGAPLLLKLLDAQKQPGPGTEQQISIHHHQAAFTDAFQLTKYGRGPQIGDYRRLGQLAGNDVHTRLMGQKSFHAELSVPIESGCLRRIHEAAGLENLAHQSIPAGGPKR